MSILSQAMITITARALHNRTAAMASVMEQPVDPVVESLRRSDGEGKPTIAVYVESSEGSPVGLETQNGRVELVLKVIAYTPPSWRKEGEEIVFEGEATGAGLNILGRQIDVALHTGNETWVKLFRSFAKHIDSKKIRYLLIEVENGIKIPAIEIAYDIKGIVFEPQIGVPLFGAWVKLDTALRADGDAPMADLIKSLIEEPTGLQPWQQFQMAHNLTDNAFISTGHSPVQIDDEFVVDEDTDALPPLENVDAEPDEIDLVVPGL